MARLGTRPMCDIGGLFGAVIHSDDAAVGEVKAVSVRIAAAAWPGCLDRITCCRHGFIELAFPIGNRKARKMRRGSFGQNQREIGLILTPCQSGTEMPS